MEDRFKNFINNANRVHNNIYNYDKVNYINAKTNIIIGCPKHGYFNQRPDNHLSGKGCSKCGLDKLSLIFKKKPEVFFLKSSEIHNNKYNYSKVVYIDDGTKVEIICPLHGSFLQTPNKHLLGRGCPKCKSGKFILTNLEKYSKLFPDRANVVHNSKYNYVNTKYVNSKTSIEIICPVHGTFSQAPSNHLSGKGCPKCNQSHGERKIEAFLIHKKLKYESQKKFDDCRNITNLSFDFWIEDRNLLIEFDGMQHFKPLGYMGGDDKLKYTIKCDMIKDEYCKIKGINLIRISYKDIKNIDKILSKTII